MPLDVARRGTLDVKDPPLKAIVAANDDYEAGYHKGNVGGLDAIDADLATANIKNGITIFGKVGSADVHDISDATAVEAEVLNPETFYAVGGGIRTGTMPTVAITAVDDDYPAGYHAGNVGGLSAIDVNLAVANILSGVDIFGFVGPATVQEIGAADAVLADVKNGKTFFSVTGGIKTGNLATVALAADNNAYPAGYHAGAANLAAIDAHLAPANILSGVNIFGYVGVATVQEIGAADAVLADVKNGKTFFSVTGGIKTGNLATVAIVAANDNYPAGYHAGNVGGLAAIDVNLAAANILSGVNIFGFVGPATVQDIADADAAVGDVKDPKTFYSVTGARKTGTMATVTLIADNTAYPAGYHAGAANLATIEAHLAAGNIRSGVNIFGYVGAATVQDISAADLTVAEAPTGKTFFAVTGGIKTGTGTKTLNPANEDVLAGYYAVTTLSAVDAQLAAANIKSGINIFGFVGVATVQDIADADAVLADVMNGKTFYSVTGGRKTGNLATVAITAANDNYPAGYHAGNVGGLDAIDADLAPANIKEGVTIFGKLGTYSQTPTLTKLPVKGPSSTGGKVTCNTDVWYTETIPAGALDVYLFFAFSRSSGTWTFRIKYKGVMKVEETGYGGSAPQIIHWSGDGDGGGDATWETHCEEDGGGLFSGSGCYITMA